MRVLCIGANGQVARSLAALSSDACEVICVGRPQADLTEPASLVAALQRLAPDLVINAAAYTAVDQAESEPALAFAANASGAGSLAKACRDDRVPLVHLSTDYVFSGDKPTPYVETDPTGPAGVYARSKLEGEQRVLAAHPDAVILRTAWVFSPFGKNFVRTMLKLGESRSEIGVVSDQFGCPTYAPDIAAACLAIARQLSGRDRTQQGTASGGIYHFAGRGDTSWAGFATEIFALAEQAGRPEVRVRPIATAGYPTPARRPANSRLECSKILAGFGIRPRPWTATLRDCLGQLLPPDEAARLAGMPADDIT